MEGNFKFFTRSCKGKVKERKLKRTRIIPCPAFIHQISLVKERREEPISLATTATPVSSMRPKPYQN